jgi:hypothetical protein
VHPVKADSVKDNFKPCTSKKGFLRRGFLNPNPAVKASTPHSSLLESIVSSRLPSSLSGFTTPIFEKGNEFRVNGLSQSQEWPVGFDLSGEVVVWE